MIYELVISAQVFSFFSRLWHQSKLIISIVNFLLSQHTTEKMH